MYSAGDVLWGADPYHADDGDHAPGGRPWLVLGGSGYPETGQFLCCALTTSKRKVSYLVPLGPQDWVLGRSRYPSKADPATLLTLKQAWVRGRVGQLGQPVLEKVRSRTRAYIEA